MSVRIHVRKTLDRMADAVWRIRHAAEGENVQKAEAAARIARQLVPVDTGALRNSIQVLKLSRGAAALTAGGPDAPYVSHVEFGTTHADAQPFFTPAVRSVVRNARVRRVRI